MVVSLIDLLLDGTDESGADAGERILIELVEEKPPVLLTESTKKITSEGQIPIRKYNTK